jgi:hypothetical protein
MKNPEAQCSALLSNEVEWLNEALEDTDVDEAIYLARKIIDALEKVEE